MGSQDIATWMAKITVQGVLPRALPVDFVRMRNKFDACVAEILRVVLVFTDIPYSTMNLSIVSGT